MRKILFVCLIPMLANNAFADENITMGADQNEVNKTFKVKVPAPGEDLNITVDVLEPAPVQVPNVTNVVHIADNRLALHGGPSVGGVYVSGGSSSYTGGVVGGLGRAESAWQLQGQFRLGSCADDRLAVEGGLAVTHMAVPHFRFGLGADVLYCSDTGARLKEKATERIVSASVKAAYEFGPLALEVSVGVGQKTEPTPGSRHTEDVGIVGLSIAYLFGQ